jgi:hypothetical protein
MSQTTSLDRARQAIRRAQDQDGGPGPQSDALFALLRAIEHERNVRLVTTWAFVILFAGVLPILVFILVGHP